MDQTIMTKPTIVIYCGLNVKDHQFDNFLYGIEEEGIPWHIEQRNAESSVALADLASHDSALAVGVGISTDSVTVTYKNLPSHQFIYKLQDYIRQSASLRVLGSNAARLAKGNPFKRDNRLEVSF